MNGIQQWIGCLSLFYSSDYKIEAIGAAWGYDSFNRDSPRYRGRLAKMIGIFSLIKGESIKILVGREGAGGFVRGGNTPLIIAEGGGGIEAPKLRHGGCDASSATSGRVGFWSWSGGSGGHGAHTADINNSGNSELFLAFVFKCRRNKPVLVIGVTEVQCRI